MLFARLHIHGPAERAAPIQVAGFYGRGGRFERRTVSVAAGLYSAELDCDGGLGLGRVHRLSGFATPTAARHAAIEFAARRLGRAVLAGLPIFAAFIGAMSGLS